MKSIVNPTAFIGTAEEIAKIRQIESSTGIDIGGFLLEVAKTDPVGKNGTCIFCSWYGHGPDCKWVALNKMLSEGKS